MSSMCFQTLSGTSSKQAELDFLLEALIMRYYNEIKNYATTADPWECRWTCHGPRYLWNFDDCFEISSKACSILIWMVMKVWVEKFELVLLFLWVRLSNFRPLTTGQCDGQSHRTLITSHLSVTIVTYFLAYLRQKSACMWCYSSRLVGLTGWI